MKTQSTSKQIIHRIRNKKSDYDIILEQAKKAKYVLIGESTHGTEEFYHIRAELTKRLIKEQGFKAVLIEGDWPDTYNINRYVKGDPGVCNSFEALKGFKRFPTWMWRNNVIVKFIDWLHKHNSMLTDLEKVGFYGLDLYSLIASIEVIIKYLEKNHPEAANLAKQRYACFNPFKEKLQNYSFSTAFGISKSCEDEVVKQLIELNNNAYFHMNDKGVIEDEFFQVLQNAFLVKNAEKYYRLIFGNSAISWNIRDKHMAETLDNLNHHISTKLGKQARFIIWAHNSHIGNSKATEFHAQGQFNIGQLVKEKYANQTLTIGFLTYTGTVTAASSWDAVAERKVIRPALQNSYEYYFHNFDIKNFFVVFKDNEEINHIFPHNLLERAIGVIYAPKTERVSHYFYANLSKQFDIVIYLDHTTALIPLDATPEWHKGEIYETFPSGL